MEKGNGEAQAPGGEKHPKGQQGSSGPHREPEQTALVLRPRSRGGDRTTQCSPGASAPACAGGGTVQVCGNSSDYQRRATQRGYVRHAHSHTHSISLHTRAPLPSQPHSPGGTVCVCTRVASSTRGRGCAEAPCSGPRRPPFPPYCFTLVRTCLNPKSIGAMRNPSPAHLRSTRTHIFIGHLQCAC